MADSIVADHGADPAAEWRFTQSFDGSAETWCGTKAQLQAAGLGPGLRPTAL
jgi:hypothetical protein